MIRTRLQGDTPFFPNMLNNGNVEVCLKEDVDKVIAELKADYKEACERLQTANLIKDEQLAAIRHHKYKRCVAMADFCSYKAWYYKYNGKEEKFYRWMKFRRVFVELYNKFKEAK